MSINFIFNYSPNFDSEKRTSKEVKFIIFHYTGMKNEKQALRRLTDVNSKVSSHYLIKSNGNIVVLVPDLYNAWHAGISSWKKDTFLNKNSIGIEICNPGHGLNYKKFSKKQINSLIKLSKLLIRKYKIKKQNVLGHSDIAPERKKDPGEKFPWNYLAQKNIGIWHNLKLKRLIKKRNLKTTINEKKIFFLNLCKIGYSNKLLKNLNLNKFQYSKKITIAFQRRFRQDVINGVVDQECLIISENLIKKFN